MSLKDYNWKNYQKFQYIFIMKSVNKPPGVCSMENPGVTLNTPVAILTPWTLLAQKIHLWGYTSLYLWIYLCYFKGGLYVCNYSYWLVNRELLLYLNVAHELRLRVLKHKWEKKIGFYH